MPCSASRRWFAACKARSRSARSRLSITFSVARRYADRLPPPKRSTSRSSRSRSSSATAKPIVLVAMVTSLVPRMILRVALQRQRVAFAGGGSGARSGVGPFKRDDRDLAAGMALVVGEERIVHERAGEQPLTLQVEVPVRRLHRAGIGRVDQQPVAVAGVHHGRGVPAPGAPAGGGEQQDGAVLEPAAELAVGGPELLDERPVGLLHLRHAISLAD